MEQDRDRAAESPGRGAPRGRGAVRRHAVGAGAACLALAVLTACAATEDSLDSDSSAGPLVLRGDGAGGGIGDIAPPRRLWDAATWPLTIGGLELCTTDPDADLTIEGLTPRGDVAPQRIEAVVRRMTPALREAAPDGAITTPFLGSRGTPPNFDEPYSRGDDPLGGDFSALEDARIDQRCEGDPDADDQFTELLVTAYADEAGALVTGMDLTYNADGVTHVLDVPWELALCGHEVDTNVTPSC